ncbi:hypothetical protein DL764_007300 [Monosporascus ibericus]|uniref:Uncharacterized protein n=1 Tax=Monosporascus ibericus TaxID=155417 RepID=A0A4Q4T1Z2_9PEZI|nr:hypothetical protein DL764_007300 [Monosporascus ibericus]
MKSHNSEFYHRTQKRPSADQVRSPCRFTAPRTTLVQAAALFLLVATTALATCRYCAPGRKTATGTENANTEKVPPGRELPPLAASGGAQLLALYVPLPLELEEPWSLVSDRGSASGPGPGPGSLTEAPDLVPGDADQDPGSEAETETHAGP